MTDSETHDAWFRAKVQEALDDPRPLAPHDAVEADFAKRRNSAMARGCSAASPGRDCANEP